MNTYNESPNFSIIVPGGCNAKCQFCFWGNGLVGNAPIGTYLRNLDETLRSLPSSFFQVSVTGGEPMLSKSIVPILAMLIPYKPKYHNILLTTNGTNLVNNVEIVSASVDHINISRHHYLAAENQKIFGGTHSVSDEEIRRCIDLYSENGIDVSFNCVIDDSTTKDFIEKYIVFAKDIGAFSVRFRKINGSLDNTAVENEYANHKVVWEGRCPVCRTTKQYIHGLTVFWKSSVLEPSDIINGIYEIVFAPDGKTYLDWKYEKAIDIMPMSKLDNHQTPQTGICGINAGVELPPKTVSKKGSC